MTRDAKGRAEILRATANAIELLAPFDTSDRLTIIMGSLVTLESGSGSAMEKDINQLVERAMAKVSKR